ncbi:MAG TPA: sigma factor-like helix-turn-helix DNA-binding protein, partial [Bacillota bacterium]|nr:sigma factor-like helix-turn-helix DNA-binding protein [Bacillota bacterium]
TTARSVRQMRQAALTPASLDAPMDQDGSGVLAEIVEDEKAENPYEELQEKGTTRLLQELVKSLSRREVTILSARFGLDGSSAKTLEEIGAMLGVTRERVRQLQEIALAKLRRMLEKIEATRS